MGGGPGMLRDMTDAPLSSTAADRPASLLLWRLLSLLYDLFPALALWMLLGALFVAIYTLSGHAERENIAPFSAWQWALWACCWGVTGVYATMSWRRGGQTLGMRPYRWTARCRHAGSCGCGMRWARRRCWRPAWGSGGHWWIDSA